MLARLDLIEPFTTHMTMVPAAAVAPEALATIERHLAQGRTHLRRRGRSLVRWLHSREGRASDPADAQSRLARLRNRFNATLTDYDVFSDVITQRAEHQVGTWLAGLDVVADDMLRGRSRLLGGPPVICYLERGRGAAIRRAKTRLPAGRKNPVAIVRIPRERMVSSGLAASLAHEVGHQASVDLGLIDRLRAATEERAARGDRATWCTFGRWASEILADTWAMGRVGVAQTLGLIAVMNLPRLYIFRDGTRRLHPTPWIRVKLSCALGDALRPHPQWGRIARSWERMYPLTGLARDQIAGIQRLEAALPELADMVFDVESPRLGGRSLGELFYTTDTEPEPLLSLYRSWRRGRTNVDDISPTKMFATIGQARASGVIGAESETRLLVELLERWAVTRTMELGGHRGTPRVTHRHNE